MNNSRNLIRVFLYMAAGLFLIGGIINCGGSGSSSGPIQVQAPTSMIQDYIAKHKLMIDKALVNFYAPEEQPAIAAHVEQTIEEKKAAGELEKLQQTTFDFANTKIAVVGEKEATYQDVPTTAIKVAVTGSYVMKQDGQTTTVPADQTIILEMVDSQWKVTEKNNPFKEYHYNKSG